MPVMKREQWLKLTPREKVIHYAERVIDRIQDAQARYDRAKVRWDKSHKTVTIPGAKIDRMELPEAEWRLGRADRDGDKALRIASFRRFVLDPRGA